MSKIISLDCLKKVTGVSFEEIIDFLDQENSFHNIIKQPDQLWNARITPYFRDSELQVFPNSYSKLYSLNFQAVSCLRGNHFFIRAGYQILPGFDFKELDGPVVFEKGLLVERVGITRIK